MSYVVAVRALCEFAAKVGDLDHRFTPGPTAAEGIAGHAAVAMRRSPDAENEVPVSGTHGPLRVRGRADGWDPSRQRLEEVKTYRGDLDAMPANHRAHELRAEVTMLEDEIDRFGSIAETRHWLKAMARRSFRPPAGRG